MSRLLLILACLSLSVAQYFETSAPTAAPVDPRATLMAGFATGQVFVWTDPGGRFKVTWKVNDDQNSMDFIMEGKATGYISVGFSDSQFMSPSDCISGWVGDLDGMPVVYDTYSPDNNYKSPTTDTNLGGTNDVMLLGGFQEAGSTVIAFRRPVDTGDAKDWVLRKTDLWFIWGTYDADPFDINNLFTHTQWGAAPINLWTGKPGAVQLPASGILLLIICLGLILIFVVFRFIRKLFKIHKRKQWQEKADYAEQGAPRAVDYSKNNWRVSGSFYRGSNLVVPQANYDSKENEAMEKKSGSNRTNKVSSFLSKRVPMFQFSIGTLLLLLFYTAINIFVIIYTRQYRTFYKNMGQIAAANAFLLALPATRNSVLVWFLGLPFDKTILYHRWLGRFAIIVVTIHVIACWAIWPAGDFSKNQKVQTNMYGLISWICAVLLWITSIDIMRRKKFEIFLYSHFIFLFFYIFGALHNHEFVPYAIAAAVFYVVDRLFRLAWGAMPSKTLSIKMKDAEMVQVKFGKHFFARLLKMHDVGQYIFVNFPQVSFMEWHPFSISSGPRENSVEIHVKALGDHTRKLVEAAKSGNQQLWIRTDGPYGNYNMNYRRYPVIILVSGGIGVTPIMSMLKDIYNYGDLNPSEKRQPSFVQKVYLMWIVQTKEQYVWFRDELISMYDTSTTEPKAPLLDIRIYTSRGEGGMGQFFYDGKPNFDAMFDEVVQTYQGKASVVFTCGPRQMVNQCWDATVERKASGHTFHFHHETFEF